MEKPTVIDLSGQPEQPSMSSWARARQRHQEVQTREQKRRPFAQSVEVTLPADGVKTIVAIGSPGIGSVYSNMLQLDKDLEAIRKVDGAYALFVGPLISNVRGSKAKRGDIISQVEQIEAMREKLQELDKEGKIIGAVQFEGSGKIGEEDDVEEINVKLHKGMSYPIIAGSGKLKFKFDGTDISYTMKCYNSTGAFASQFNKNHPNLQRLRVESSPDGIDAVVMVGPVGEVLHRYFGFPPNRAELTAIRAGSYQGRVSANEMYPSLAHPDHSRRGIEPEPSGQALQLNPFQKEMTPFLQVSQALQTHQELHTVARLEALRKKDIEWKQYQAAVRRRQAKAQKAS